MVKFILALNLEHDEWAESEKSSASSLFEVNSAIIMEIKKSSFRPSLNTISSHSLN